MSCQSLPTTSNPTEDLKYEFQLLVCAAMPLFKKWLHKHEYTYDRREELLQRTLVIAWCYFPRWQRRGTFLTLLISIARNEQKKLDREEMRKREMEQNFECFDQRLYATSVDETYTEMRIDIDFLLSVLSDKEKVIVKMHTDGFYYWEIAEVTGGTEEGIKKRFQRAIIRMRNLNQSTTSSAL